MINKSKVSKGKLVDKYRNKLAFLRKGSLLKTKDDASFDLENDVENEGIFDLIGLMNCI